MKCKVINSHKNNLEQNVNEWLQSGNYEITEILQTEDSSVGYITLTIFYLETKEVRKKKLDKLNKVKLNNLINDTKN